MYLTHCVSQNIRKANILFNKGLKISIQCRSLSSLNKVPFVDQSQYLNESVKEMEWTPIYRFPFIGSVRFLNRFKLYQTVVTGITIPITAVLAHYNFVDFDIVKVFMGCGVFACLTLYPMTWFFRRSIGMIYVSNDNKLVKIAHLTFWGNRQDVVVPLENIVPLSDCEYNPTDLYVKLQRYDVKDVLFFTLKFGQILHREKFETVFGDLSLLGIVKNNK